MNLVKVPARRRRGGVQPAGLSLDDVLAAGLAEVEVGGLDSLTTGSVARRLGVSAPAIYHYVRGNPDLVNRVCERVAMEVHIPDGSGVRWDDRIVEIVLAMNRTFERYPGVAAHVLPFRRASRAADRLDDEVRAALADGGFTEERREQVLAALHFIVGGWLLGRRPRMGADTFSPDLLAATVRWTLAGASN